MRQLRIGWFLYGKNPVKPNMWCDFVSFFQGFGLVLVFSKIFIKGVSFKAVL